MIMHERHTVIVGFVSAFVLVIGVGIGLTMIKPVSKTHDVTQAMSTTTAPLIALPTIIETTKEIEYVPLATTTIVVVGDIMLDRNVQARTDASKNPSYPFAKLPFGWFESFDYAVANLEGPVTDQRRSPVKSIDFLFRPEWLKVLVSEGIDAVSQANNHAFDQGRIGFEDSRKRLTAEGILAFGEQVDDGDIALGTATIGDTRVAFLGWNSTDNPVIRKDAEVVMTKAKEQNDLLIAYLHWGTEYRAQPDASSVELAHWLIDQGVDVVIGGHPHWSQGASVYKNKPILWSLGNFIFDQDWSEETRYGLAASLEIIEKKVVAIELYPVRIDLSQPRLLEGEQKRLRLEELAKRSDQELADGVRSGRIIVK